MEYKIIDFNETTAELSILVEGYPVITVKLPVDDNGNVPEGAELNTFINGFLPHSHVQRLEQLKKGIPNIESIKALVDKDYADQQSDAPANVFVELTNSQLLVLAISERDNRLRGCDWTQLPDVQALHDEAWIAAWRKYRAELRDFPNTITNVKSVKYPIPPLV